MSESRIAIENQKPGTAKAIWDAPTSNQIEGFATQISVDNGDTVEFKINVNAEAGTDVPYRIEIYRLGYYGGDGATLVTTINTVGQAQPDPIRDARGVVDAGNWEVSASWDTPEDAVSGVYLAKLQRLDSSGNPIDGATNQIPFIVRDDDGPKSDILLQTSDTTWHAYNGWSGNNGRVGGNFYGGFNQPDDLTDDPGPFAQDRAFAVSYNRPIITRDGTSPASGAQDYLFGADYAAIFWLEQNGYDVSYISGVDTDRLGADYLIGHKAFISVGHDEYWSGDQRDNVEAARDAGVNLLFWSGNEVYWKTRWETSIDGDGVEYRTLVCYKETWANGTITAGPDDYANIDPSNEWTGTWRDLRFVGNPGATGQEPENSLTGQLFGPDGTGEFGGALDVPASFAALRYWRDTGVPETGQVDLAPGIIGYEWNVVPEDEYRPAGLIKLSSTTLNWSGILVDQGNRVAPGTATHNLSLYRDAESGALVFGAGTVFWTWALSDQHDSRPYGANIENLAIQQFTVNMFADMGIQPATLQESLVIAAASTDSTPATVTMANLADSVAALSAVIISGTAADTNGTADPTDDGQVAVVEVSFDGGATWRVAQGTTSWTYTWRPTAEGTYTILARAIDDSLNVVAVTSAQDTVLVTEPVLPATFSLFDLATPNGAALFNDGQPIEIGMKFAVDRPGSITELRYWRAASDAGDIDIREGHLWRVADGALLGTVTFTSAIDASGWQFASLAAPVAIGAGEEYVVSYRSLDNYVSTNGFFAPSLEVTFDGVDDDAFSDPFGVISAPQNSVTGEAGFNGNGVYRYGGSLAIPNETFRSSNYWVDVTFAAATGAGNAAPTITSGNFTAAENQTAIGSITATDPDGNAIRYGIAGGADAARFTINAITGALAFVSAPDFEAPSDVGGDGIYDLIVSASDLIDAPVTQAITVTITDAVETGPTGSTLFGPGETPDAFPIDDDYELGVKFTASVDGQITALRYYRGAVDADDTDIRTLNLWEQDGDLLGSVTVTSDPGESGWQVGTLTVPIAITANTLYVASYGTTENYAFSGGGLNAGRTSADGFLTAPAGSLVGGNGVFAAGQPGAFPTASFNNANYWVDVFFSVANNAPTALDLSATSIAENNAPGALVATLSAVDADAGDTFTFALAAGGGDTNNAAFSVVGNQLVLTNSANFEAQSAYSVRLQVTDAAGAIFARTATIAVTNAQEGFSGGVAIAESTEAAGVVPLTATNDLVDPDGIVGGITYSWRLVAGDVEVATGANFDATAATVTGPLRLFASYTDGAGETVTVNSEPLAIDFNDAPTALDLSATTTPENNAPGAAVATLSATDADAGDTFTYALIAGDGDADNAAFSIVGDQLVLTGSADFEAQSSYTIRLQVTDAAGATFARTATIAVTNVQEGSSGGVQIAGYTTTGTTATLTAANDLVDPDGIVGAIAYSWQLAATGAVLGTGPSFTAGGAAVTGPVQLVGIYTDTLGETMTRTAAESALIGRASAADNLTGGAGPSIIVGLGRVDSLTGGAAADTIDGGDGSDTIDGGGGADLLIGGFGSDRYRVDNIADTIVEIAGQGLDVVEASVSFTLAANVETLILTGSATLDGTGSAGNNTLTGNGGANTLNGQAGKDTLNGGAGADTLLGGEGNDQLLGGEGADILVGGLGVDFLTGDANADIFRFDAPGEGRDQILDFNPLEDSIGISAAGFGGLDELAFRVAKTATGAGPQFFYNATSGVLFWDADGAGGTGAVALALLTTRPLLDASDLVLVA